MPSAWVNIYQSHPVGGVCVSEAADESCGGGWVVVSVLQRAPTVHGVVLKYVDSTPMYNNDTYCRFSRNIINLNNLAYITEDKCK